VNVVARVNTPDGPLKEAAVEIVSGVKGQPVTIGTGKVNDGLLDVSADPGPVWGLRIDGQPVVGFPVSFDGSTVDLGDIDMLRDGVLWPAFHAVDGRVYGVPRASQSKTPTTTVRSAFTTIRPALATGTTTVSTGERSAIPIGELYGNTAQQLDVAARMPSSRFALAGATVILKGVASVSGDAIGLKLPTPEAPPDGAPVSEVSFTIQPRSSAAPSTPQTAPTALSVPNLVGYTREFAIRKAAVAGFITEVNNEIVATDVDAGRVIRQLPPARAALPSGGLIRLYIGKRGGS
jgi:hypothetical protein